MNYQERLRAHLVKYKFRALGIFAGAKPHVLPEGEARLNILPPYRERFWSEFDLAAAREGSSLALAADFTSLASSQALAFNLFYPLVVDRSWAETFVESVLGVAKGEPTALAFEYGGDRTTFSIRLDNGEHLRIEPRLGELTFGPLGGPPYLVFPRANLSLRQRVPPGDEVPVLHLEDLCEKLKPALRGKDDALKAHYREFAQKYLVDPGA